jgi:histidinol-phosphatase (PHP family)
VFNFDSLRKSDLHIHDCYSHDGKGTVEEYAYRALDLGLERIAITNHIESINSKTKEYEIIAEQEIKRFSNSLESIKRVREKFPNLEILFGIEIDNSKWAYSDIERVLSALDFDIVIGSVHFIDELNFSGKSCRPLLQRMNPYELHEKYFKEVLDFFEQFDFDVVGHLELVDRNLVDLFPDYNPEIDLSILNDIFSKMKEKDIALEINTGGFFQAPKISYPSVKVVDYALSVGIDKFSFGSDAHCPENLGKGFNLFSL